MTLYEFNLLSEIEKLHVINEMGARVAQREESFYRYELYQVSAFYVEVKYAFYSGSMESNRSFSFEKLPEQYLAEIDISSLV